MKDMKKVLWTLILAASAHGMTRAQTLKIMTYNIHHANPPSKEKDSTIDLKAVAAVINAARPDLVALQEIDVNNGRAGLDFRPAETAGPIPSGFDPVLRSETLDLLGQRTPAGIADL